MARQSSLVSIMMPAYNAEKYIGQAIESVLAQSYSHWELIIVNDGSTDNTTKVVVSYPDTRIRLIHQENGGEAAARNTALKHMQGDYVSFLDADDLYLSNALADLSKFLDRHSEYDVVFSDGHFCDEHGRKLRRQLSEIRPGIYTGNILEPLILNPAVIGVPVCVMVRRDIIEQLNVRFDENLVIGPDWDFWIQLARHVRFGYLDTLTCMYRVHNTNITRTSGLQKRKNDLVHGRMKILKSDWFGELSLRARRQFFYNLLIKLLINQPAKQNAILQSKQFQSLPKHYQAQLYRLTGVNYLLKRSNQNFAINCLQAAMHLEAGDWRSRFLLWGLQLGELPVWSLLHFWQAISRANRRLYSLGQHKPKPVPTELRPTGD